MNVAFEGGGDPSSDVVYMNFNQNSTALSVGTKTGYKLFALHDVNRLLPDCECETNEDVCLVERHYSTSLVMLVKLSSPRKLTFYNFSTREEITVKHFSNTILAVKTNRKVYVVCLEDSLHIFDIVMMNLKHVITNTPSNPKGLCALTSSNNDSLLAYPGSSTVGDIQIFDATKLLAKTTIPAHNSPVVAIAFNDDGTKIASASEKGTVIRIFDVTNGHTLFEFRRGVRYVTVYSLSFSPGSEFLCASSNTETVHIFKLANEEDNQEEIGEETEGWVGAVGKMLTHSAKYLPAQMSDVLTQTRSFAAIHLPFSGLKNISTIARIGKVLHVFVASADGFLYIYYLNMEGGPCALAKQHRIDGNVSTNKDYGRKGHCDSDEESDNSPPRTFSVN